MVKKRVKDLTKARYRKKDEESQEGKMCRKEDITTQPWEEKQKTEKKTQQEQAQEYYEKHEPGELEKLLEELMDDEMEK